MEKAYKWLSLGAEKREFNDRKIVLVFSFFL